MRQLDAAWDWSGRLHSLLRWPHFCRQQLGILCGGASESGRGILELGREAHVMRWCGRSALGDGSARGQPFRGVSWVLQD